MAYQLHELLGMDQAPAHASAWHELLDTGLPVSAFKSYAKAMGMSSSEKALAEALFGAPIAPRTKVLTRFQSSVLWRAAKVFVKAEERQGSAKAAATWLRSPNALLKGRVPLELLSSHTGAEYALVAAERG